MENLARIEIPDACEQPLVEQRHFDGPVRPAQCGHPILNRHHQDIRSENFRTEAFLNFRLRAETDGPQPPAIPEPDVAVPPSVANGPPVPQMSLIRRIADEHQTRHSRFDDKGFLAGEFDENPLGPPHHASHNSSLGS